ncbi:MAG: hypothetical protein AAGN15_27130 [Cyanobacteria bacterium J06581_3]
MRFSGREATPTPSTPSVIANFRSVVASFLCMLKQSVCVDGDGNGRFV